MSKTATEQLGKNADFSHGIIRYNAGVRKWWKRQASKMMRRLARLGDDAPKKRRYSGWND